MKQGELGRVYQDGEVIFHQGETGEHMYVIQEGQVEICVNRDDEVTVIAVRSQGDFFGEMALFDRVTRMATARARGKARVLSVDQKNLMRRIHQDPSLAFRIIQGMSQRIRDLSEKVASLE